MASMKHDEQVDLRQRPGPKGLVAVLELLTDPAHRTLAHRAQAGLGNQALDVAVGEAAHVGADDQGLERPGPEDHLGVRDDAGDEALGAVTELGDGHLQLTLGGLDAPGPHPVARPLSLRGPLIAGSLEEGSHLFLDPPLEHRAGPQPSDFGELLPGGCAALQQGREGFLELGAGRYSLLHGVVLLGGYQTYRARLRLSTFTAPPGRHRAVVVLLLIVLVLGRRDGQAGRLAVVRNVLRHLEPTA